jgi:hypothetical protein
MTDDLLPVEGCECGCNDTVLDKIKKQVACYEARQDLTHEEQESLDQARIVLATVAEMEAQGHEIRLDIIE